MPKSRAVYSTSYRGRIGKTTFGGHYVDYLERRFDGLKFKAFDPDLVNASLRAYYPKAEPVDFGNPLDFDRMLDALKNHELVFCDGLGGHYQSLEDWMKDVNLFEITGDLGVVLTFVVVVTDNVDTIEHAAKLLKFTPPGVDFLIVKNAYFSSNNLWEKTKTYKEFKDRGALEFTLPNNHHHIALLLDKLKKPAFSLAAKEGIQLTDRQRFLNLGRKMDAEFDKISRVLLPEAASTPAVAKA